MFNNKRALQLAVVFTVLGALQRCAAQCTPTEVADSDKKAAGSITGETDEIVSVSCDAQHFSSDSQTTCTADQIFAPTIVCAPCAAGSMTVTANGAFAATGCAAADFTTPMSISQFTIHLNIS
jgi:hypothetical protein